MLTARTLIKRGEEFVFIEDWEGPFPDPNYVEGALVLTLDGKIILDETLWDDMNYLWPYIANGLPDILDGKDFETGFPDQPITFRVRHLSPDWLLLHVFCEDEDYARVKLRKADYLLEMTREARNFFTRSQETPPGFDQYVALLDRLAGGGAAVRHGLASGMDRPTRKHGHAA